MPYSIELNNSAIRALKKLPRDVQVRIGHAIDSLALNPRPDGCLKMTGMTVKGSPLWKNYLESSGFVIPANCRSTDNHPLRPMWWPPASDATTGPGGGRQPRTQGESIFFNNSINY